MKLLTKDDMFQPNVLYKWREKTKETEKVKTGKSGIFHVCYVLQTYFNKIKWMAGLTCWLQVEWREHDNKGGRSRLVPVKEIREWRRDLPVGYTQSTLQRWKNLSRIKSRTSNRTRIKVFVTTLCRCTWQIVCSTKNYLRMNNVKFITRRENVSSPNNHIVRWYVWLASCLRFS